MTLKIRNFIFLLLLLALPADFARAGDAPPPASVSLEEQRYQKAIADFTAKMKDMNYPALFDKAAQEFNVPADILKGVAFAETRWTQLQWPPGETVSPDTGMPRPYGIMSLWDNAFFGHSLQQAAQLIGQDPETLKTDAFQNIRGAAALLRQIYEAMPKPEDAPSESQVESWRKAIVKFCGIPQPELSEQHALKVYEFMNAGYHQYGLEWDAHPVNLAPMRADVARIQADARTRAQTNANQAVSAAVAPPAPTPLEIRATNSATGTNGEAANAPAPAQHFNEANERQRWWLLGLMVLLLVVAVVCRRRGPRPGTQVSD